MQKGGKKKTAWMQHVTKTMAKMPNVALKDVLKAASKTYKKGKSLTGKALMVTKRRRRRSRKARRKTRRNPLCPKLSDCSRLPVRPTWTETC